MDKDENFVHPFEQLDAHQPLTRSKGKLSMFDLRDAWHNQSLLSKSVTKSESEEQILHFLTIGIQQSYSSVQTRIGSSPGSLPFSPLNTCGLLFIPNILAVEMRKMLGLEISKFYLVSRRAFNSLHPHIRCLFRLHDGMPHQNLNNGTDSAFQNHSHSGSTHSDNLLVSVRIPAKKHFRTALPSLLLRVPLKKYGNLCFSSTFPFFHALFVNHLHQRLYNCLWLFYVSELIAPELYSQVSEDQKDAMIMYKCARKANAWLCWRCKVSWRNLDSKSFYFALAMCRIYCSHEIAHCDQENCRKEAISALRAIRAYRNAQVLNDSLLICEGDLQDFFSNKETDLSAQSFDVFLIELLLHGTSKYDFPVEAFKPVDPFYQVPALEKIMCITYKVDVDIHQLIMSQDESTCAKLRTRLVQLPSSTLATIGIAHANTPNLYEGSVWQFSRKNDQRIDLHTLTQEYLLFQRLIVCPTSEAIADFLSHCPFLYNACLPSEPTAHSDPLIESNTTENKQENENISIFSNIDRNKAQTCESKPNNKRTINSTTEEQPLNQQCVSNSSSVKLIWSPLTINTMESFITSTAPATFVNISNSDVEQMTQLWHILSLSVLDNTVVLEREQKAAIPEVITEEEALLTMANRVASEFRVLLGLCNSSLSLVSIPDFESMNATQKNLLIRIGVVLKDGRYYTSHNVSSLATSTCENVLGSPCDSWVVTVGIPSQEQFRAAVRVLVDAFDDKDEQVGANTIAKSSIIPFLFSPLLNANLDFLWMLVRCISHSIIPNYLCALCGVLFGTQCEFGVDESSTLSSKLMTVAGWTSELTQYAQILFCRLMCGHEVNRSSQTPTDCNKSVELLFEKMKASPLSHLFENIIMADRWNISRFTSRDLVQNMDKKLIAILLSPYNGVFVKNKPIAHIFTPVTNLTRRAQFSISVDSNGKYFVFIHFRSTHPKSKCPVQSKNGDQLQLIPTYVLPQEVLEVLRAEIRSFSCINGSYERCASFDSPTIIFNIFHPIDVNSNKKARSVSSISSQSNIICNKPKNQPLSANNGIESSQSIEADCSQEAQLLDAYSLFCDSPLDFM